MENRTKFWGLDRTGKPKAAPNNWSNDNIKKRITHIEGALKAYRMGILDDADLTYVIKNALVSKIHISVAAKKILDQSPLGTLSDVYQKLVTNMVAGTPYHGLDLQDTAPLLHSGYFDICKVVDRGLGVRLEHVVPGSLYLEAIKNEYYSSTFRNSFKSYFDCISICIVTVEEAKKLDASGLRNQMPEYVTDFRQDPYARYKAEGIDIW